jgi:hypothetical protein
VCVCSYSPWAMRVMPRTLQGWMARRALRWLPLPCRADLSALPECTLARDAPGKNLYFHTFAQPHTPFVGFDRVFAAEADGLVRQPPAQDAAHAGVGRYTVGDSRWLRGPCGTLHTACAAMLGASAWPSLVVLQCMSIPAVVALARVCGCVHGTASVCEPVVDG